MQTYQIVLLSIGSFWVAFWFFYSLYWFTRKFKYLDNPELYANPKNRGFIRHDKKKWSFCEFFFTGLLLLPIRLPLIVFFITLQWLLLKPFSLCYSNNNTSPIKSGLFRYQNFVSKLFSRIVLFMFGFLWIKKKKVKFDPNAYPLLNFSKDLSQESIIISNHVSDLDNLVHSIYGQRGFMAKHTFKDKFILGFLAQTQQCHFVDRFDVEARKKAMLFIQDRVKIMKKSKYVNKLVIYPEGTVSNGRGIINFKVGAFSPKVDLRVMGLKYRGSFDPIMDFVSEKDFFIGTLCNFVSFVEIWEIDKLIGIVEDEALSEPENVNRFLQEVRRFMINEYQFEDAEGDLNYLLHIEETYMPLN